MSRPRNIVLLVADSLRWDSVHRGGDHRLPYLQARAARFDQARAGGCWTLPATASMFTGLSPHEHGADSQSRALRPVPTLAERAAALGYTPRMVTANVATTDIFGLDRGFESLDRVWKMVPTHHRKIHEALVLVGKPRLRERIFSKDFVMGRLSEDLEASKVWLQSTAGAVFDRARALLDADNAAGRRTMLFLNLMETHFPYHTADTFETTAEGLFGALREVAGLFHLVNQTWLTTDREHIRPDALDILRRRQRLAWERLAPAVDAFCQEMRERYEADVVFCSDHGDNFGEQGWLYHFSNVTDAGNRVPLYVLRHDRDASAEDRARQNTPVSARDLYGTLLRAAGDRDPTLVSLLSEPERSTPILESFWYNNHGRTLPRYRFNQFAFIEGGRRFVQRNGAWFEAPITEGDASEAPFQPLPSGTRPVEEIPDADRRAALRRSLEGFEAFSEKILSRERKAA